VVDSLSYGLIHHFHDEYQQTRWVWLGCSGPHDTGHSVVRWRRRYSCPVPEFFEGRIEQRSSLTGRRHLRPPMRRAMKAWTTVLTLSSAAAIAEAFSRSVGILTKASFSCMRTSMTRLNRRGEIPGSELFPGKGPYIPSGLSAEQYARIKKEEDDKRKKMDFAAWGPRFKRSEAPIGDWMVMPSLWTNGFKNRSLQPPASSSWKSFVPDSQGNGGNFVQKISVAILVGFILLDTIMTGLVICRTANLTLRQAALLILRAQPFFSLGSSVASMIKLQAVKVVVSALFAPLMARLLGAMNRTREWSSRRIIGTSIGASVLTLVGLVLCLPVVGLAPRCVKWIN